MLGRTFGLGSIDGNVFRQHEVRDNRHQEHHSHAVIGKYVLQHFRQQNENLGHLSEANANGKRQRRNKNVALRKTGASDHLETAHDDIAEHHNGAAAKHSIGQRGKHHADNRQKRRKNHDDGARGDCAAIHDLRYGDQAHVLREARDRQAAKTCGDRAYEAVARNRARKLLLAHVAPQADHGKR